MSYANGVTYIDDIPLVQLPKNNSTNYNSLNNYNKSSNFKDTYFKEDQYDESGIHYPKLGNPPAMNRFANYPPPSRQYPPPPPPPQSNDYYEEVIQSHPSIQSKIRQTDKYTHQDAIMGEPIPSFSNAQNPPQGMRYNSQSTGSVQGNYETIQPNLSSNLEQNMGVVQNYPLQYNRPFAQSSGNIIYPIVEHNDPSITVNSKEDETSSSRKNLCEECQQHNQSCGNCQIHRKLYYLLIGILVFLLLIFLIMCYLLYKYMSMTTPRYVYTTPHTIAPHNLSHN